MSSTAVHGSLDSPDITYAIASFSGISSATPRLQSKAAYIRPSFSHWTGTLVTLAIAVTGANTIPTTASAGFSTTPRGVEVRQRTEVEEERSEVLAELSELNDFDFGWDGRGSVPPSFACIRQAADFLTSLPLDIAVPELSPAADGSIDWYWKTDNGVATVTLISGKLAYFAQAGDYRAKGVSQHAEAGLPDELLEVLRKI